MTRGQTRQTFADGVVLHVDPEAVAGLLGGPEGQLHQDAHVRMQGAIQRFLLLVP